MKVFVTGAWGRPSAIEQQASAWGGPHKVRRFPNMDAFDPLLREKREPDKDPWIGLNPDDPMDQKKYYAKMLEEIEAFDPDLIVTSFLADASNGVLLEKYPHKTFCVSKEAARMEDDREYARIVCAKHGVAASELASCSDEDQAFEILMSRKWNGFVLKPAGHGISGVWTEVCESREEALAALERWPEKGFPMVIEERLKGIEIAYAVLVDYRNWRIVPMVTDLEYTKLCTGDLGMETPEMGIHDMVGVPRRIMDQVFAPLIPWFKETRYVGWFDVSGIYDPMTNQFKAFEFMTRLGSSQLENVLAMLDCSFIELVAQFVAGRPFTVPWKYKHGVSTVSVTSGHPVAGPSMTLPIKGWEAFFPGHVDDFGLARFSRMQTVCELVDGEPSMKTDGQRIFVGTGASDSFEDACELSQMVCREVGFATQHYRLDIGWRYLGKTKTMLEQGGMLPGNEKVTG